MPQPGEDVFGSPWLLSSSLVGGGGGQHRTEVFLFLVSSDAAVCLLQSGEGTREAVGGGGMMKRWEGRREGDVVGADVVVEGGAAGRSHGVPTGRSTEENRRAYCPIREPPSGIGPPSAGCGDATERNA